MRKHNVWFCLFLVFTVLVFSGCKKRCTEERECFCSDGTSSFQDCYTDGSSCTPCDCVNEYSIWCDDETDLCWQDPQKDAYGKDENEEYIDIGVTSKEAVQYCEELVLGGYDDWRLPTIGELRTLIAGNPDTEAGGACPVDDDCTFDESWDPSCIGGPMFQGPGVDGCYLKPELTGTCDKPDIYSAGHYLEVWAQESASDDERWISSIMPEIGGVTFNHICSLGDVRCVRDVPSEPMECAEVESCTPGEARDCDCSGYDKPDGAQVCNDSGDCWGPCECTGFEPDPEITPECSNDVCPDSDKLRVTINLPEGVTLSSAPHMLIAFFYEADRWTFPPGRPPDGGTVSNQIIDPGFPPYEMTIPACTYYGEYFLEGNYNLYIHLQAVEKFPPAPVAADYYWGADQTQFTSSSGYAFESGQTSFSFPITGGAHDSTEVDLEIVLEPAGCPDETPIECTSGDCVADASVCGSCGDGQPIPDDSNVLSCRYESAFLDDNCADFPIDQGWTAAMVDALCKSQIGADQTTVVVTQGNSCKVEDGMSSDITGCMIVEDGREWFIYGAPEVVCSSVLQGTFYETGPFCEEY